MYSIKNKKKTESFSLDEEKETFRSLSSELRGGGLGVGGSEALTNTFTGDIVALWLG